MATTQPQSNTAQHKPKQPTPLLLRPVAYPLDFVKGTVGGGLNGMGRWGRVGAFWGTLLGGALFVAAPPLVGGSLLLALMGGFVGGLTTGAVVGGVTNSVTGGTKEVAQDMHNDNAADAAAHHKHAAPAHAPKPAPSHADKAAAEQAKKAHEAAAKAKAEAKKEHEAAAREHAEAEKAKAAAEKAERRAAAIAEQTGDEHPAANQKPGFFQGLLADRAATPNQSQTR